MNRFPPFLAAVPTVLVLFGSKAVFASHGDVCLEVFSSDSSALQALVQLRIRLDSSQVKGASASDSALEADFQAKLRELARESEGSNLEDLKVRIRNLISLVTKTTANPPPTNEIDRRKTEKKMIRALVDGTKLDVREVSGGAFTANDYDPQGVPKSILLSVSRAFWMGSAPVTRSVWTRVIDRAKQKRIDGASALPLQDALSENGVLPQTNVSAKDVETWLRLVNVLADLGDPLISELNPDHVPGAIYRLPTEAEYLMVATDRGRLAKHFPFADKEIGRYAWISDPDVRTIQKVASKEALIVEGGEFYDLYGNVFQILANRSESVGSGLDSGDESTVKTEGPYVRLRGGDVGSSPKDCYVGSSASASSRLGNVGFRIVMQVF